MREFACDLESFKKSTAKFIDRCKDPSLTLDQLAGAKKALAIQFLNFEGSDLDAYQASIALKLALDQYQSRLNS